jgi:chromosome segregation ATPase
MEDQVIVPEIKVTAIESEVNVCFEHISQTRYSLLRAREELKNAQADIKMIEGRLKFMREVEVKMFQDKINNMRAHISEVEKRLRVLLDGDKKDANQ